MTIIHTSRGGAKLLAIIPFFLLVLGGATGRAKVGPPSNMPQESVEKVSEFGLYEGYSDANAYDGYERRSVYVTMRDGVRIAVDYFLPTKNGKVAEEKLPVLFHMTPYGRAWSMNGEVVRHLLSEGGELNTYYSLLRRGYVLAVADTRGQGASFGGSQGMYSAEDARDGYDLVQWFSEQPWSSGKVGMIGVSYMAGTQYLIASENPSALKAIFPIHAVFDNFEPLAPNGVFNTRMRPYMDRLDENAGRSESEGPRVTAVDGPNAEALFAEAQDEHRQFDRMAELLRNLPDYMSARDAYEPFTKRTETGTQISYHRLDGVNEWGGPIYHWGAWNDYAPLAMLRWFINYHGPDKLVMSPATHSRDEPGDPRGIEDFRIRAAEAARWFDYWLKGIDNGVMDDPSVRYALQIDGHYSDRDAESKYTIGSWKWRTAENWPPKGVSEISLSFADGQSNTVNSVNDGFLVSGVPVAIGSDDYKVDPTVTTGLATRLADSYGIVPYLQYPDMRENDRKSLTYTTEPLEKDIDVVGAPVVLVYAKSTAPDGAIFARLEEVDEDGYSTLVSFGALKASHRTLGDAPYDTFGDPWPTSMTADIEAAAPFNSEIARLEFALQPTATRFRAGKRIRIALSGVDADNYELIEPDATVTVMFGDQYTSMLRLPVLKIASDNKN
ncbi:MAG: CocE/NonD family hydrolase [Pseudomonadota bacterium]